MAAPLAVASVEFHDARVETSGSSLPRARLIALDTSAFIYLIEKHPT